MAGGVNLYGFGNGDPLTYGDPYGLSAEETEDDDDCCRLKEATFRMRGVTPEAPPASCNCDSYSRQVYEPLTVSEAKDASTMLAYMNVGKGAFMGSLMFWPESPRRHPLLQGSSWA